ncbi:calcium-activated chloride channel regulator 4A-like [Daphnia pulicaria]|uniref:calcium-activated chloride channel regulator 4A-like n=1 Tax=Daphnia pulicaria TaxID=35523 RepID=UPI001EEC7389|nr:calcium-activated chloride channel regulator 4A-like [Daphnia pulicaria]
MNCRFNLFIALVLALYLTTANSTSISIANNAYSNIVVAISPDVPNTWSETILKNIQLMIRRASSVLYRATEKRAYFKDVRILVPESWSNIRANLSTWETYSEADVRVAPPRSTYGNTPYTVQSGGCGQPGEYIHLTPDYLRTATDPNTTATYGQPEKVFVHEWSHLRYGVFDEYGYQGDKKYPLFYKEPNDQEIQVNLCSDTPPIFTTKDLVTQGPCKIDPATGVYDNNCAYQLSPAFLPDSSLMSVHSLDSVVDFCKEDQALGHVFDAPNKHNAMCGGASTWTVITLHPDFAMNNNPPNDVVFIEPNFQIVRSSGSRFVLVSDTSGSMNDYNRIVRLYESSRRWIKYDISDGSKLGMVQFASNAKILSPIVEINGDASREALIARLPVTAVGGTCIGCGLQKALDLLRPGGPGGVILLLTDGEETDRPFINDVISDVIKSGARVVSIAFGRKAEDKIEDLATKTNGKSYFIDDNDSSQGLNDAFIGSLTYQPAVSADQIVVLLFQRQYQNVTETINENFSVDSTVGRNFIFRIDYTQKNYLRSFSLKSPSRDVYSHLVYDDVAKVAMFKLAEAEVGKWYFTLTVTSSTVDAAAVHVTSQTRSTTTAPITTECYVPDGNTSNNTDTSRVRILAKVMQGANPVVRAKVKARVEMPSGPAEVIELLDNGASADTTADDGIYSRYFVSATTQGRYTVECEIWSDGSAYVNVASFTKSNPQTRSATSRMTGLFTRMADGGSFKMAQSVSSSVDNYPPSRITDLFVVDVQNNPETNVTIQFTAPGEDLDFGTASSYEIRYSPVFNDLRAVNFGSKTDNSTLVQQEHVLNGSLQPLESGSMQIISFVMKVESSSSAKTYYVALRALDRSGQAGTASNIVSAQLYPSGDGPASSLSTKAIIAIAVGSLLGCLLIAAIAYLIARKKYLSYDEAKTRP